ncbi:glutaredoxin-dependent arsenate reductase [Providencia sp. CIM-Carb-044]|uniref:glutaredoxin-dependent arsenate reductase n=1 Tax=Providencia sp. CIM-Carb-044 TaxID=3096048 RepID=UPI0024ABADAD|nr:glutaredoxin-dependent arsenate reductase [Providencia sp. CIM-Carb-044]MCK9788245.1 glutaredoxin-dependent arsenate reductase [Providencia rettgeri]MDX7423369.1 glutaredoxin-dependent arsenate reductase [Providencia sp. CIM-Carb-044]
MNEITIYHNPNCGTSRNTLAMIRNSGVEPTIIYYLETPPTKDVLIKLIADMKITVRALLRKNVEPYEQLNLKKDSYTDDQIIDFMLQYPILINRPIVVTPLGVKLCRPSEVVLDILPQPLTSDFIKEDGQIVISNHHVKHKKE